MTDTFESGYAAVDGLDLYWESRGTGGVPLVVVHGGFGVTSMFGELLDQLARDRRVIAFELQGHGHTADIDRPFSYPAFGDDIGAAIGELGLDQVDLLGYSLGAGSSLRAAIQHPALVRRLIVVSTPCRRDGWLPDVRENMAHVGRGGFEQMQHAPPYAAYVAVAPDPDAFPELMDKMGALLMTPYDWSDEVAALAMPTLLVFGDADSVSPAHAAEFYALLGGGLVDAGWDGSLPNRNRLAILPGRSHYDIFGSPELTAVATSFLAAD